MTIGPFHGVRWFGFLGFALGSIHAIATFALKMEWKFGRYENTTLYQPIVGKSREKTKINFARFFFSLSLRSFSVIKHGAYWHNRTRSSYVGNALRLWHHKPHISVFPKMSDFLTPNSVGSYAPISAHR